ncbi:ATP-dependent helicase HrpB [sulfur-oxidizing endosymbiont of Gigantopelta aegis]|uniref:ATP-dependent helicase HrpB n=1 Tax=sulfur-oxidizing endosymbiont of Gigantopelta aegis TaxID=2794934 RepID=UPI0018DEAC68|nr:ATP-dependent helicase HrpB [sulfur-oxidizing endosymbiont of Gigantopelta aegis]
MPKLPVTQVIPEIQKHLLQSNRLVLQAPPGAGKTTLVPLALLDQPWLKDQQIIMLEPRRLATRSSAARMAHLLGEKVGETVGYQIRQDRCFSKKTKILVVTEGILTRKLQADPELKGIALVIFDEFHERNIHADLSLAFCLQSQEYLNEQLKILVMSATLNTQALLELLNAPLVSSQGRTYPVNVIHQAHITAQQTPLSRYKKNIQLIAQLSQQTIAALAQHTGNILIFLPGVREIKQLEQALHHELSAEDKHIHISPLYGDLTKQQQDQAISPPPSGQRKIVLATNIAETSLTIEGINVVIDSGLQKEAFFNPGSGMNALHTAMIAQDSAAQRSGRAGRLGPGTCYRLWSEAQHKRLPKYQKAEILRSDLAPVLLELAKWGVQDVNDLNWLDIPPPGAIAQAHDLLLNLQAISASGQITPHGQAMLSLGIHPRLAHMLLTARQFNLVHLGCLLVALLTEKDFLVDTKSSDIAQRVAILQQMAGNRSQSSAHSKVKPQQCRQILKTAKELQQRVSQASLSQDLSANASAQYADSEMIGVLLGFAYPDRIAKLRNTFSKQQEPRYLLSNSKGAYFAQQEILSGEAFLVIPSLHEQTNKQAKEARIFLAASISQAQIEHYFSDLIHTSSIASWDKSEQKVTCLKKSMLGALVLKEQLDSSIEVEQMQSTLLQGIKGLGLSCLPWSKQADILRQRVEFVRHQQSHNDKSKTLLSTIELPDFSESYLLNHLAQWLQGHLNNENSIKKLQHIDLTSILSSQIDWNTMQLLNELAPEKISVPSGSQINIDYSDPDAPVLAVRLQELFGLQSTPAILKNSFPLLLHLLSPARRPMQVTHDLASFWKNTYNEVKKELRGKYKKHYWPDDPLQAQATNRVKPRKHKH